ncbi:MAG: aldo/keto reductase [Candidatus Heimdallarchaeota archaeon]
MKYQKLGNTGMHVSKISLGTMFYGGAQFQATDSPVLPEVGRACIEKGLDVGINYLDCADIYGAYGGAEEIIGNVLQDHERGDVVISTKVHVPMSPKPNDRGLSRKHITESIKRSLDRLKTDYVDLYYCHRYDYSTPLVETVLSMNQLIEEGYILYWATSNWSSAQLERAYGLASGLGLQAPVCDQVRYNVFLRYGVEVELPYTIDYTGLGVVAYRVLSAGLLSGKYNNVLEKNLTESDRRTIEEYGGEISSTLGKFTKLNAFAEDLDISLPQLAYVWVLQNESVSTALMSTSKPERIEENIQALDIRLDTDQMNRIEEILGNTPKAPKMYRHLAFGRYRNFLSEDPRAERGLYPPDPRVF